MTTALELMNRSTLPSWLARLFLAVHGCQSATLDERCLAALLSWLGLARTEDGRQLQDLAGPAGADAVLLGQVFAVLDERLFEDGRLHRQRAGVGPLVPLPARRRRYRLLLSAYHPDRFAGHADYLTVCSQAILAAYREFKAELDGRGPVTGGPQRTAQRTTGAVTSPGVAHPPPSPPPAPATRRPRRRRAWWRAMKRRWGHDRWFGHKLVALLALIASLPVLDLILAPAPTPSPPPPAVASSSGGPAAAVSTPAQTSSPLHDRADSDVPTAHRQPPASAGDPTAAGGSTPASHDTSLAPTAPSTVARVAPTAALTADIPAPPASAGETPVATGPDAAGPAGRGNLAGPALAQSGLTPDMPAVTTGPVSQVSPSQEELHVRRDPQAPAPRPAPAAITAGTGSAPVLRQSGPATGSRSRSAAAVPATESLAAAIDQPAPATNPMPATSLPATSSAPATGPGPGAPVPATEVVAAAGLPRAPAPAAAATVPDLAPADALTQRQDSLMRAYQRSIESGDLRALAGLLAEDARENEYDGRNALITMYQDLFQRSQDRSLALVLRERWPEDAGSWVVQADYQLTVHFPDRQQVNRQGQVRYRIRDDAGGLLISGIEY